MKSAPSVGNPGEGLEKAKTSTQRVWQHMLKNEFTLHPLLRACDHFAVKIYQLLLPRVDIASSYLKI